MAQIDTGLGWRAEDNYLISAGSYEVGRISGGPASGIQVPAQYALIAEATGLMGESVMTNYIYAGVVVGDSPVYMVWYENEEPSYGVTPVFYSDSSFTIIYYAGTNPAGGVYAPYSSAGALNNTMHLTYYGSAFAFSDWTFTPPVSLVPGPNLVSFPTQEQRDSYATAILSGSSATINKLNAGYAIGALVKWWPGATVDIITPILISSVSTYTDMSTDASEYNFAKTNYRIPGMRFFMGFFDISDNPPITSTLPLIDLSDPETYGALSLEDVFNIVISPTYANLIVTGSSDPYEDNGGASEEDGGDGNTVDDDPVTEQTLPLPSVTNLGFCTIYIPTASELMDMASYLWSGNFDIENVIRLFSNPLDSVIGLSAVPVDLAGVNPAESIYLGGVQVGSVTMHRYVGRTSVPVDFGSVSIKEKWGSYLDYTPYTEFSVYLPFIGIKNIKADDIMGKTLSLKYYIDIVSGGCIASLRVNGGSVIYEYSGQCALQIPITSQNYDNIFNSAISAALALTSAFSPSASGPVLAGAVASAATQNFSAKPSVSRSGGFNGITGFLGQLQPYILRTVPKAYIPNEQNKFIGYPSFTTKTLGEISGYNEIASIHLENIPATGAELTEIENLLKGGVIL